MAKKHYTKESRCISQLTVHVGSASSLIDMMRYDCCFPATEDESRKIWKLIGIEQGNPADRAGPEDHVIRLHRVSRSELPATDDRWRSFGCRVLDERPIGATPITDDEALNLAKVLR